MKVTRIAYSNNLNKAKYSQLVEQAHRLGAVRAQVWRRFGSTNGVGISDRQIRDQWLADGTAEAFGVLANAWKETVRDAMADIKASREAARVRTSEPVRHTACCATPRTQTSMSSDAGGVMLEINTSKVSRWDHHGREHVVRVQRKGAQRSIRCDTCGWRKAAQFLPWLKAEEHLAEAHQATVDPPEARSDR